MTSEQSRASQEDFSINQALSKGYYDIALPGLQQRMGANNQQLGLGEPEYMKQAYEMQRGGLAEGTEAQGALARSNQLRGAKGALTGGNMSALLSPASVGAQLANALYGSKFQEGMANLGQQFNLINMGLGGAGTAGSGALDASRQQLQAIGFLPNYNPTYANVVGGLAGGASLWGALQQANPSQGFISAGAPGMNTFTSAPASWITGP